MISGPKGPLFELTDIEREDLQEDCEHCQRCRRAYPYIYAVPDYLWAEVTGKTDGSGLLCIRCFDKLAREKGIYIYWGCTKIVRRKAREVHKVRRDAQPKKEKAAGRIGDRRVCGMG